MADLKKIAATYLEARKVYMVEVRKHVQENIAPMNKDDFWYHLERLAEEISRKSASGVHGIKPAIHNFLIDFHYMKDGWDQAAAFLAAYKEISKALYDKCFQMSGVAKGDDSYDDWTDALPLAGFVVVRGILEDELETYKHVSLAIQRMCPKLEDRIQEGENHIRMSLEEALIERFAHMGRFD